MAHSAPRLLDSLCDQLRAKHYSIRTETGYADWVRRFVLCHHKRHPETMAEPELDAFLTSLAVQDRVAASTQNQALSALPVLYRQVLQIELDGPLPLVRAKKPQRPPVVLTRAEVRLLFKGAKTAKGHRIVAASPDVIAVLDDHRQRQGAEKAELERIGLPWPAHGLVFASEIGTPISPDNLVRLRNRLMDLTEVPRATLHGLGHLHALICVRNGINPKEVADRRGRARASFTLDHYTHQGIAGR